MRSLCQVYRLLNHFNVFCSSSNGEDWNCFSMLGEVNLIRSR